MTTHVMLHCFEIGYGRHAMVDFFLLPEEDARIHINVKAPLFSSGLQIIPLVSNLQYTAQEDKSDFILRRFQIPTVQWQARLRKRGDENIRCKLPLRQYAVTCQNNL